MINNFLNIIRSLLFFLSGIFTKRRFDVVFYYPQHFNRGDENKNQFFEHLIQSCIQNNISYIVFEEPDFNINKSRNKKAIPFDFIYLLILLLRKVYGSKLTIHLKDKKIGSFIAKVFLRKFRFKNYITLSQSMLSVFRGIGSDAILYDLQHGIIHNEKKNYLEKGIADRNLTENNANLLLNGESYKRILISNEKSDYFQNHVFVIGSNINTRKKYFQSFNNNVLVTLQFTHDHTDKQNLRLFKELNEFILNSSSDVNFYLKHHPRFNNEVDLTSLLELSNVSLAPNDINECFNLCSLHATAYSTSTFEAALLGIPSIIIKGSSEFNFFNNDFNYPLDSTIECFKDKSFYQESSEIVKNWAFQFYTPFDSEKFISLLK